MRFNSSGMIQSIHVFKIFGLVTLVLIFTLPGWVWQVQAAPPAQPTAFKTPTARPDGRIFYIVQEQDTLWSISAITGISLDQLRAINNLHPNESIRPGQQLFFGMGGPAAVTPTPGPTQPLPTPTISPTPAKGTAILCVLLYDDLNGNSLREEDEPSIPKGAIHVGEQSGKYSKSEDTLDGLDPNCFNDLPPGAYNVSVALPDGFNPTTTTNYQVELKAGDETYVDFGAQSKSNGASPATPAVAAGSRPAPVISSTTPILGVLGGVFVLIGVALFLYATRLRR
jgi:murein DD-endopeptidase MepM/ murein hydrolase activator NlpD